MTNVNMFFCCV